MAEHKSWPQLSVLATATMGLCITAVEQTARSPLLKIANKFGCCCASRVSLFSEERKEEEGATPPCVSLVGMGQVNRFNRFGINILLKKN